MSDYIKREDLLARLGKTLSDCRRCKDEDTVFAYTVQGVITTVREIPAADMREHVRGKWIHHEDDLLGDYWECSNCHDAYAIIEGDMYYDFCPNCGADMREES